MTQVVVIDEPDVIADGDGNQIGVCFDDCGCVVVQAVDAQAGTIVAVALSRDQAHELARRLTVTNS